MDILSILMPTLLDNVNWNYARINFLARFLIALLKVKTVNFVEIATAFGGEAKKESSYKRIQRFFRSFVMNFAMIALLIVKMLPITDSPWILTLDRTNWKLGKTNINILMLGIVYKGIAFPVFWILLEKRGNSNTAERIEVMDLFISLFGVDKIQCLTADREFIGEKWFSYLLEKLLPFRIRIKENMKVTNSRGTTTKAKDLFRDLAIGEHRILSGRRLVCGHRLFIIGLRLKDEFLIIVTNHNPDQALDDYACRWAIEPLFACLKTRGFCFEQTHLTDPERIKKLVALLALAFTWSHIVGQWLHEQKPIKIKKHGRKAHSFFRYGFDYLRMIVLNFSEHIDKFFDVVKILHNALDSPAPFVFRRAG